MKASSKAIVQLFPLTAFGVALCVLAFWAFKSFAIAEKDFFVRALIVAFFYLYLLLTVMTMVVRFLLSRRLRQVGFNLATGETHRGAELELVPSQNGLFVFPAIEVSVKSREPWRYTVSTNSKDANKLIFIPRRRGRIEGLRLEFNIRDVFGLNHTTLIRTFALPLTINPNRPLLESTQIKLPNDGEDSAHPAGSHAGDYVDMRRYAPGDPQRFILWKAFARSRKLLVRTPERAQSEEPAIALILLTHKADAPAADVARYFLEQSEQELVFGATGGTELAFNLIDSLELLRGSGHFDTDEVHGICQTLLPYTNKPNQRVVIIASAEDHSLKTRIDQIVQEAKVSPYVILASCATAQHSRNSWQRLGFVSSHADEKGFSQLQSNIAALREHNHAFEVINPQSGKRWEADRWHL